MDGEDLNLLLVPSSTQSQQKIQERVFSDVHIQKQEPPLFVDTLIGYGSKDCVLGVCTIYILLDTLAF